ncbi:MAG: hypothetical protein QNJ44_16270 [Rhodobacter sp.]|nr:hypothetical protein [Rhodobacter sp.]
MDQAARVPGTSPNARTETGFKLDIEPFHIACDGVLPMHRPGICFHPDCSRPFNPTRDWQKYCSAACRQKDDAELRRVGMMAAPAMLTYRMTRNRRSDPVAVDTANAARRYTDQLISDWVKNRAERVQAAEEARQCA